MNTMKAVVILALLLVPFSLMHVDAQEKVNVDIADGSKDADNGRFYVPARVTVPVGTTVVWKNFDDAQHTITSGTPTCVGLCWGLDFDSGIMRLDEVYEFTFDKPGTYNYLCSLHPWMIGRVAVLPEGSTAAIEVSVETDRTSYKFGDSVNVKGSVSPVPRGEPVTIEVLNPSQVQFTKETVVVKEDGMFSYDFKLVGDLALPGSYIVKVTYSDASTESTFAVEKAKPDKPGKPDKPDKDDKKPPALAPSDGADVRIVAKQVRDFVIMRVKNADDSGASVYGISVEVPDSVIQAFKGPRQWSQPESLSSEVRSSTDDRPIEPGEKAVFRLKIDSNKIVINWNAYDLDGNVIDQGETTPLSRGR